MKTIWKFPLGDEHCVIPMPDGAQVLEAREQHGSICLWAIVDDNPTLRKTARTFRVVGTGTRCPEGSMKYIGQCQMHGGKFIFHIFEVLP